MSMMLWIVTLCSMDRAWHCRGTSTPFSEPELAEQKQNWAKLPAYPSNFLARPTLWHWWWKHNVPPKCQALSELHVVTNQESVAVVRTSHPATIVLLEYYMNLPRFVTELQDITNKIILFWVMWEYRHMVSLHKRKKVAVV
jgi:hypothetical protein